MGLVDWTVLIVTLLTIVIYGSYKTKKNSNIQSFLKANNSTGWFTIGLSVMATKQVRLLFYQLQDKLIMMVWGLFNSILDYPWP